MPNSFKDFLFGRKALEKAAGEGAGGAERPGWSAGGPGKTKLGRYPSADELVAAKKRGEEEMKRNPSYGSSPIRPRRVPAGIAKPTPAAKSARPSAIKR